MKVGWLLSKRNFVSLRQSTVIDSTSSWKLIVLEYDIVQFKNKTNIGYKNDILYHAIRWDRKKQELIRVDDPIEEKDKEKIWKELNINYSYSKTKKQFMNLKDYFIKKAILQQAYGKPVLQKNRDTNELEYTGDFSLFTMCFSNPTRFIPLLEHEYNPFKGLGCQIDLTQLETLLD